MEKDTLNHVVRTCLFKEDYRVILKGFGVSPFGEIEKNIDSDGGILKILCGMQFNVKNVLDFP